ncbi:hypothetical protein ACROYT_G043277 [Oculina patagonica]
MAVKGTGTRGFLPGFFDSLKQKECRERYAAKLNDINGQDSYEIPRNEWLMTSILGQPKFSGSPYTKDQLMNYKSLDCYQNFANGWVREVFSKKFDEIRLLIGKVNHSQRMSEKPLTPWVVCEKSGKVLYVHCDCMAGLAPSETELKDFLNNIKKCNSKPALLSLIPAHSNAYIPKSLNPELPEILLNLFDSSLADADYPILLKKAEEVLSNITVSKKQQQLVEEKTRDQANSRLWFRMRTGQITASKFKSACQTDPSKPSHSLVMGICHPEMALFNTEATKWGCQHELTAREAYYHPYLGASPDGLVHCKCCGAGACEIKCPFCHKNDDIATATKGKNFCLEQTPTGRYQLKRSHQYYYQVQLQLLCSTLKYIDFVVWTQNGLFIERIFPDKTFWNQNVPKLKESSLCVEFCLS